MSECVELAPRGRRGDMRIKTQHQWLFIPDIEKKKRTYESRLVYESRLSTSHSRAFLETFVWFWAARSGASEFFANRACKVVSI
jgi:hypothetical protein